MSPFNGLFKYIRICGHMHPMIYLLFLIVAMLCSFTVLVAEFQSSRRSYRDSWQLLPVNAKRMGHSIKIGDQQIVIYTKNKTIPEWLRLVLCHDRLDRHPIESLSFARHEFRRCHLVPSYTENWMQNIKRNPRNRKKWIHSLTVIVSTVRVLLLTVCDEIISPSAEYPGLFSPKITWCCSLPDEGPAPTIVDTVDVTVAFGSLPSSYNETNQLTLSMTCGRCILKWWVSRISFCSLTWARFVAIKIWFLHG